MSGAKEQPEAEDTRGAAEQAGLSEQDALELLDWSEGLRPEFKTYFRSELAKSEQNRIHAKAEEYCDLEDYQKREMSPALVSWVATELPAAAVYAESISNAVGKMIGPMIEELSRDPKIRLDRKYAEKEIARIWKRIKPHIRRALGIDLAQGAPQTKEELHREWSRRMYLGDTPEQIADEFGVADVEHVKRSVLRLREHREQTHWLLCAAILRAEKRRTELPR